jgi:hypothetical protein
MTIKIVPNEKGNPSGSLRMWSFTSMPQKESSRV